MAIPLLLCGTGVLFATCAACFYRMGAADWVDEKKLLIDSLESLASENAKLRELVQGLWFAAQYLGMNPDGATGSGFARQMRELGVEVDE